MKRNTIAILVVVPLVIIGLCVMVAVQVVGRVSAWIDANSAKPISPSMIGNCALADIDTPSPTGAAITLENTPNITRLAQWGNGLLFDVAWSPQSDYIALARSTGVYLYQGDTFELVRVFDHPNARRVVFSPDGSEVATQDETMDTQLWRVTTGERFFHKTSSGFLQSDLFGPEGQFLIVSESVEKNYYRELKTVGSETFVTQYPVLVYFYEMSGVYDYGRSGDHFAIGADDQTFAIEKDGTVTVWNIPSGLQRYMLAKPDELEWAVTGLAFSPDMQFLAVARYNKTIEVHRADNGDLIRTIEWGARTVETRFAASRVLFSADGTLLAGTGEYAEPTILWDTAEGNLQYVLAGNQLDILAFSPDGRYLAVGNSGHDLIVQSFESGTPVATLEGSSTINSLALHPTKPIVAYESGGDAKVVLQTDVQEKALCTIIMASVVEELEFSPDGTYLLTTPSVYNAFLWNMDTGELEQEILSSQDKTIHFHPNGTEFVLYGYRTEILKRKIFGSPEIQRFRAPIYVQDMEFRPTSNGEEMVIWEGTDSFILQGEAMVAIFEVFNSSGFTSLQFTPDGEFLAMADVDEIRLTEIDTEHDLWHVPIENATHLAFSHDGTWLAVVGMDKYLSILDSRDGTMLWQTVAHHDRITSLAVGADDHHIFTASEDGTVAMWGIP